jgi:zinc protease
VYAVVPPIAVARTEQLIDAEIAHGDRGSDRRRVDQARNQALAGFWRGLQTISGKADALGTYEIFHGDYTKLFEAPAVYETITAADVMQVAQRVLRKQNRTVGVLQPEAAPERKRIGQESRDDAKDFAAALIAVVSSVAVSAAMP